jgi:hypothetical protein
MVTAEMEKAAKEVKGMSDSKKLATIEDLYFSDLSMIKKMAFIGLVLVPDIAMEALGSVMDKRKGGRA